MMYYFWESEVHDKLARAIGKNNFNLKNAMLYLLREVNKTILSLPENKIKRVNKLYNVISSFLYVYFKRVESLLSKEDQHIPNHCDIIAALLSCMNDLCLLIANNKPDQRPDIENRIVSNTISYLSHCPGYILDVIIQTNAFKKKNLLHGNILRRFFIEIPKKVNSPKAYLKFLAALRMYRIALDIDFHTEVRNLGQSVKPPKKFAKWLRRFEIDELKEMTKKEIIEALLDTSLSKKVWKKLLKIFEFSLEDLPEFVLGEPDIEEEGVQCLSAATSVGEEESDGHKQLIETLNLIEQGKIANNFQQTPMPTFTDDELSDREAPSSPETKKFRVQRNTGIVLETVNLDSESESENTYSKSTEVKHIDESVKSSCDFTDGEGLIEIYSCVSTKNNENSILSSSLEKSKLASTHKVSKKRKIPTALGKSAVSSDITEISKLSEGHLLDIQEALSSKVQGKTKKSNKKNESLMKTSLGTRDDSDSLPDSISLKVCEKRYKKKSKKSSKTSEVIVPANIVYEGNLCSDNLGEKCVEENKDPCSNKTDKSANKKGKKRKKKESECSSMSGGKNEEELHKITKKSTKLQNENFFEDSIEYQSSNAIMNTKIDETNLSIHCISVTQHVAVTDPSHSNHIAVEKDKSDTFIYQKSPCKINRQLSNSVQSVPESESHTINRKENVEGMSPSYIGEPLLILTDNEETDMPSNSSNKKIPDSIEKNSSSPTLNNLCYQQPSKKYGLTEGITSSLPSSSHTNNMNKCPEKDSLSIEVIPVDKITLDQAENISELSSQLNNSNETRRKIKITPRKNLPLSTMREKSNASVSSIFSNQSDNSLNHLQLSLDSSMEGCFTDRSSALVTFSDQLSKKDVLSETSLTQEVLTTTGQTSQSPLQQVQNSSFQHENRTTNNIFESSLTFAPYLDIIEKNTHTVELPKAGCGKTAKQLSPSNSNKNTSSIVSPVKTTQEIEQLETTQEMEQLETTQEMEQQLETTQEIEQQLETTQEMEQQLETTQEMEQQLTTQEVEQLETTQEVEQLETTQEVEQLETTQEVEQLETTQEVEQLETTQEVEQLETTQEVEQLETTQEVEQLETTQEVEQLETTQEVEQLETTQEVEQLDTTKEMEQLDTTKEMEQLDTTKEIEQSETTQEKEQPETTQEKEQPETTHETEKSETTKDIGNSKHSENKKSKILTSILKNYDSECEYESEDFLSPSSDEGSDKEQNFIKHNLNTNEMESCDLFIKNKNLKEAIENNNEIVSPSLMSTEKIPRRRHSFLDSESSSTTLPMSENRMNDFDEVPSDNEFPVFPSTEDVFEKEKEEIAPGKLDLNSGESQNCKSKNGQSNNELDIGLLPSTEDMFEKETEEVPPGQLKLNSRDFENFQTQKGRIKVTPKVQLSRLNLDNFNSAIIDRPSSINSTSPSTCHPDCIDTGCQTVIRLIHFENLQPKIGRGRVIKPKKNSPIKCTKKKLPPHSPEKGSQKSSVNETNTPLTSLGCDNLTPDNQSGSKDISLEHETPSRNRCSNTPYNLRKRIRKPYF